MARFNRNKEDYTDLELQAFCRAGNTDAFTMLHDRYIRELFRSIKHMHYSDAVSEEVAEDTMLQLHTELRVKGSVVKNVGAWLKRVAIRKNIDFIRKDRNRRHAFLEDIKEEWASEEPEALTENEKDARFDLLFSNFHRLKDEHQEILALRYLHDLPPREIVKETGMKIDEVNTLLRTAKRHLRNLYK